LLYALYRRNHDAVRMLRDRLLSLDLWEAAALGETRIVRDLLATPGASVDAFSPDGFTALQLASFFGRNEVVELLLECRADPNLVSQNAQGIRALHGAAAGHHLEIVGRLIAAGADVDARQASGHTALDTAIKGGDENMVRELTRPR
jgi:ankyrin repeat protein